MFTKEEYNKWLVDINNTELNKKMTNEFPFLIPRNVWTGEVVEDYDYSYNEFEAVDPGWRKAFGYEFLSELKAALKKANMLDTYRVAQIKEKYGTLRWYDFGATDEVHDIINKYERMSEEVCIYCGNKAEYETSGWILYVCKDCLEKHKLRGRLISEINDEETF